MDSENRYDGHRLQELSGSDFEIKDGQPNIKGWKVRTDSGERIGEVDELIFDSRARKVRYIVLDLEDNDWDLDSREVLVPIGMAEIHRDDDVIILPDISAGQLRSLPDYDKDHLSTLDEHSIRGAFTGTGASIESATAERTDITPDFYQHEHFDEERLNRRRSIDTPRGSDRLSNRSGFNSDDEPGKGYIDPDREIL